MQLLITHSLNKKSLSIITTEEQHLAVAAKMKSFHAGRCLDRRHCFHTELRLEPLYKDPVHTELS